MCRAESLRMRRTTFSQSIESIVTRAAMSSRHARSNAAQAAALIPIGALLGGCFHYVPLGTDPASLARIEGRRVRVTTSAEVVEVWDPHVAYPLLTGEIDPPLLGDVPNIRNTYGVDVRTAQRLEVRTMNRGGTAAIAVSVSTAAAATIAGVITGVVLRNSFGGGGWSGGAGRRPAGLRERPPRAADGSLGDLFASMAELEAASIPAFETLERELIEHDAPARLVRAARSAARDEVRHAITMRKLASRFGSAPRAMSIAPTPARTLREIAIENAVEGCVNETWGALVAHWQARASTDRTVRAVMRRIAVDETRHGELAWQIDAWARNHLDADARVEIGRARERAIAAVAASASEPPEEFTAIAGMPRRADADRMLAAARATLWRSPRGFADDRFSQKSPPASNGFAASVR